MFLAMIRIMLIVAAVALVTFLVWRSNGNTAQILPSNPPQASVPAYRPAHGTLVAQQVPSGSISDRFLNNDDYDGSPLPEVMHRVLATDPQLKAFKYYHNRPLLDTAEKAKYHELLSDQDVFAEVKQDLLYPADSKADQEGNIKRLMKIDYLREALEWKENPRRNELIALVVEIILTDNYPPGIGMDMRLSLSGDKKELYTLLDELMPNQAQAVVLASRGTRLERLIAYIADSVENGKRLEAKAESVIHP